MKKLSIILFCLLFLTSFAFAEGVKEKKDTVRLAVMQGPTGFSASFVDLPVIPEIYPSPNEAVSKLINGELDMAVLPANTAAALFNKGIGIKAIAVVGEGMLKVLGTDENSKTLSVPGIGGTPDHMAQLLYKDFELDYSINAPAQLAQLLIAGKTSLAILPQPFVSMVLSKNSNVKVVYDVQEDWEKLTSNDKYPMSILVATDEFASEYPSLLKQAIELYKDSVKKVLENPAKAGERIEGLGIMKASLATPAIKDCALVFKTGNDAKDSVSVYYNTLMSLAPEAIGNKVPEEDFWY